MTGLGWLGLVVLLFAIGTVAQFPGEASALFWLSGLAMGVGIMRYGARVRR